MPIVDCTPMIRAHQPTTPITVASFPRLQMEIPTLVNEVVAGLISRARSDQKHTATGRCEKDLELRHLAPS